MNNQIAIIDYGAGNIQSVQFALERIGIKAILTNDIKQIEESDKVIFPGVGHATPALKALQDKGLDTLIPTLKQPVLGICLGMQLLCSYLEESDEAGLDIFSSQVKRFPGTEKVPHLGWNSIELTDNDLFKGLSANPYVYFVHSYFADLGNQTIATTNYERSFSAAFQSGNFYGCQFHPEKSGANGEQILRNFLTYNQ